MLAPIRTRQYYPIVAFTRNPIQKKSHCHCTPRHPQISFLPASQRDVNQRAALLSVACREMSLDQHFESRLWGI